MIRGSQTMKRTHLIGIVALLILLLILLGIVTLHYHTPSPSDAMDAAEPGDRISTFVTPSDPTSTHRSTEVTSTHRSTEVTSTHRSTEVVIARYNEDLEWLTAGSLEPLMSDISDMLTVTVYNKGLISLSLPMTRELRLPNVGRCDHTFLYHIVENYDNLADVTVFLPASCFDGSKACNTRMLIDAVARTGNTVLPKAGTVEDVRNDFYGFQLDSWTASNTKNVAMNPESTLAISPIRPFGPWFDANFGDLVEADVRIKVVCYFGIFAVAREHILQHPRSKYASLLKYLDKDSNPEAGHYMERAWGAIFYPYPPECIFAVDACAT